MREIKVVVVPVEEKPYITIIKDDLKTMQMLVGGLIEVIFLQDNLLVVCDEEAKLKGKAGNRMVNGDIIAGDFFIVADSDNGEFESLSNMQAAEMLEKFMQPEAYTADEVEETIHCTFISFL